MKHTPEPWVPQPLDGCTKFDWRIGGGTDNWKFIASVQAWPSNTLGATTQEEADANAERIVRCVNACAGIPEPDRAIPELVHLVRELLICCELSLDNMEQETRWLKRDIEKALRKMAGGMEEPTHE